MFTPYSQSLERVALRKSRYLEPPPACEPRPPIPPPNLAWTISRPTGTAAAFRPRLRKVPSPNFRPRASCAAATSIRASSGSLFGVEAPASAQRREEMNGSRSGTAAAAEMMCLNALWEIGEGNVEDVRKSSLRARAARFTPPC